jgi:PAS domain S-box-containing protein
MNGSDNPEPRAPSSVQKRVHQLLQTHIRDLQAPSADEVQHLVYQLELYRAELETQNQELREIQRHLEAHCDRYVDLYDLAPLGYLTMDQDAFLQEINLAGAELLGVHRDELIGYSFLEYVFPQERESFQEHVRRCACDSQEGVWEATLRTKDGRTLAVFVRGISVDSPEPDEAWCKMAIIDISARRKAEEILREKEEWFITLANESPIGIIETNTAGDCIYVNPHWCKLSGTSADDALGRGWLEAIHHDDRAAIQRQWFAAADLRQEFHLQFRFQTPEGKSTPVQGIVKVRTDHRNEVVGYLGVVHTAGEVPGRAEPPCPAREIRVLLADDHHILREGLARLLRERPGIRIVGEAGDGRQAVELALRERPDVVLMDVSMPELDGIEATRQIKSALPGVRIIGLSMYESQEMGTAMRDAGAVAYLSKAGSPDALLAAMSGG